MAAANTSLMATQLTDLGNILVMQKSPKWSPALKVFSCISAGFKCS